MTHTLAFEYLANGSYFKAVNLAYTGAMGDWFLPLLMLFTLIMVYLQTKDETVVAVAGITLSGFMIVYLPTFIHPLFYMIIAASIGMILYKAYGKD